MILKLQSVSMRIWREKNSHLISPKQTGENFFFPFFTLSKPVSPIYLCHKEISSLTHSHGTMQCWCMKCWRLHPEARRQGSRVWSEKKTHLLPHVAKLRAICGAQILIPLSKHIWRFPDQCCLIDSDCVRGLGAVYTECQASARRMSVRTVVEWAVSDVGGCKSVRVRGEGGRLRWSAASGISKPHLACGIQLPSEKNFCCIRCCF